MSIVGSPPSWQEGTYSLYVHVPFCRRKCPYCHFYVIPHRERDVALLDRALEAEWALRRPLTEGLVLSSLYFGGGTPALVAPRVLQQWVRRLCDDGRVAEDLEITLEANPEDLSADLLAGFRNAGVNRLSIGVQSFEDRELERLGRGHSARTAQSMVRAAYEAGIANISIDLMFETPGQTQDSWRRSLDAAADLPISHVSLYNLTIEPHTAFDRRRAQLTPLLPSAEEGSQMLETAIEAMEGAGFCRYELSAFCRENRWSRHNTGYWLGRPFLGLGPSAWSFWQGRRFRNMPRLHRYAGLVQDGQEATDESESLSAESLQREMLAVQLRLTQGVDQERFQSIWGPFSARLQSTLQRLEEVGMIEQQGGCLRLTKRGGHLHDSVAAELV
jgi:oxygen-independent coproporphyrinogen-3 oxidase